VHGLLAEWLGHQICNPDAGVKLAFSVPGGGSVSKNPHNNTKMGIPSMHLAKPPRPTQSGSVISTNLVLAKWWWRYLTEQTNYCQSYPDLII